MVAPSSEQKLCIDVSKPHFGFLVCGFGPRSVGYNLHTDASVGAKSELSILSLKSLGSQACWVTEYGALDAWHGMAWLGCGAMGFRGKPLCLNLTSIDRQIEEA